MINQDYNIKGEREGVAYAFFDCDAPTSKLERAIPEIRKDARTPAGLQLRLHDGIKSDLELDETLTGLVQYPDDYRVMPRKNLMQGPVRAVYEPEERPLISLNYAIEARYAGATNEQTADELKAILTLVHLGLNKDNTFRGAVTYQKDDGEWVLGK